MRGPARAKGAPRSSHPPDGFSYSRAPQKQALLHKVAEKEGERLVPGQGLDSGPVARTREHKEVTAGRWGKQMPITH